MLRALRTDTRLDPDMHAHAAHNSLYPFKHFGAVLVDAASPRSWLAATEYFWREGIHSFTQLVLVVTTSQEANSELRAPRDHHALTHSPPFYITLLDGNRNISRGISLEGVQGAACVAELSSPLTGRFRSSSSRGGTAATQIRGHPDNNQTCRFTHA